MRVSGCCRAQWPGEEASPAPFMDMEPLGASFNTVSRKTEQEGASSLRSTEHGSGGPAGALGSPASLTEAERSGVRVYPGHTVA